MSEIATAPTWAPASRATRLRAQLRSARWPTLVRLTVFPAIVLMVIIASQFVQPNVINPLIAVHPPMVFGGSPSHLLGTDDLGRDELARLLYGARLTLEVSSAGVLLGAVVGVPVGFVAALGGRVSVFVALQAIDIQLAFPYVLLALFIVALVQPSLGLLIVLLALAAWVYIARVVRSLVLLEKQKEYAVAARLLGIGKLRLSVKYIGPEVLPVVGVTVLNVMAGLIVLEAGLDFLGLGLQPPTPSLGSMIYEGIDYLSTGWWISTLPGIAILAIVASLFAFSDGLHRLGDPQAQKIGRA